MADVKLIKQIREMTQAGFLDCKKALEECHDNLEAAVKYLREKGLAKAAKKAGAIAAEGAVLVVKKDNVAVIAEINSQTDFAAKNENFVNLTNEIMVTLLNHDATDLEAAKNLKTPSGETINSACEALTGKIGEKISLRRFQKVVAQGEQDVGIYQHANKKYASLVVFDKKVDEQLKKNIAMHVVAMNPKFVDSTQVDSGFINLEKELLQKAALTNEKFKGKPAAMIENIVGKQLDKRLAEVCLINQAYDFEPGAKVGQVLNKNGVKVLSFIRYEVGEGIEKKQSNFAAEVAEQMGK